VVARYLRERQPHVGRDNLGRHEAFWLSTN
jgi:hypothetical protein